MRTPQKDPIKRKQLLDAAAALILSKGYAATSVDMICARAKTSKGAFFHYFKKKEDVAIALLNRPYASPLDVKYLMSIKDPVERVFHKMDMALEFVSDPNSCISGQIANELSDTHPEIRKLAVRFFDMVIDGFAEALTEAKAQHGGTFDPRSVAELYMAAIHGCFVLTKVRKKPSIQGLIEFRKYLRMIVGK